MKNFLIILLSVLLVIALIGAVAILIIPDEPVDETPSTDSNTDTGSGSTPDTDLDTDDNGSGIGPQKPPIILVEDVEELTTALASIENGATIEIPSTIEIAEPLNVGNKEVTLLG